MFSSAVSFCNNLLITANVAGAKSSGGLFSTMQHGANNLVSKWNNAAAFGGAICILVAIGFVVVAVCKQRDKSRWWIASGVAFAVGAILIVSGSVNKIQGYFSNTQTEVFGKGSLIDMYTPFVKSALGVWFNIWL